MRRFSRVNRAACRLLAASLLLLIPVTTVIPLYAQEASVTATRVAGVPREECFPLETLPAELRPKAEQMLLTLLDGEALYTIVGGIKPMSTGFGAYRFPVSKPETKAVEEARQILAAFRCGEALYADLLPYRQVYNGKRECDAIIFNRGGMAQTVTQYNSFFAPYGITPSFHPLALTVQIEQDMTTARNRGLGYLFGYPKHAVDFYVLSAEKQKKTKVLVPRDFIQIPTYVSPTGRFVYAVPKGYKETEVDKQLRTRADKVLAAYRERRARYIGEGKPGVVALLRDWMDDGTGRCAPENARF